MIIKTPITYLLSIRSINFAIREGLFCASSTIRIILENMVWFSVLFTSIWKTFPSLIVPAKTSSFNSFSTGTDSPVKAASFTIAFRSIKPSIGIWPPFDTTTMSPITNSFVGVTTTSPFSFSTWAVSGTCAINSEIALVDLFVA